MLFIQVVDPVDLEGALDRFYFISLLEEGELSRSTQFARLTW